jgi:hypothetical protein
VSVTRYRDGDVTIEVSGTIADLYRRAADAASRGLVSRLEAIASDVATDAERQWYGLVTRRTGRSGDIGVTVTISESEVRVSVGSTDTRRAGGKPVPLYVRQPRSTALLEVEVSNEEWGRRKRAGMPVGRMGIAYEPNPKAAQGTPKFLVPHLVSGPMKARVKAALPELKRAIITEVTRG